jgi:hypothetical protein
VVAALAVGAVILVAMICVSGYGWITLPADARVPIHFGVSSYNNFVPKQLGLVIHPAAGALIYAISTVLGHGHAGHGGKSAPYLIMPAVMGLLLVVQVGAIRVARRR